MKKIEPSEIGKNPDLIASEFECLQSLVVLISIRPFASPPLDFTLFQKPRRKWLSRTSSSAGSATAFSTSSTSLRSTKPTIASASLLSTTAWVEFSLHPSRSGVENSKIILARDPTENLGLPVVEADSVQVVGQWGGQPMEALQDVDGLGGDNPTIVVGSWWHHSVFRTRKSSFASILPMSNRLFLSLGTEHYRKRL